MPFTHLHVHSHYSLLDGLGKIDELVKKAKEEGMKALALTDHGVMYGVIEFYQKCKAAGLKPIIGVEFYLAPNGRKLKRAKIDDTRYHVILLAKNKAGYQNLIKLTTLSHLEGFYYKPRIDWELLEQYHDGLIAATACLQGEIPTHIQNEKFDKAEKAIERFINLFGKENFYLEIQPHPNLKNQGVVNKKIIEYAKKFDVPLVAANDAHYINSEDDQAQDVLLCLQTKKKREDKDRLNMMGEDFSFKSEKIMREQLPEAPEAIDNTQKIVDDCHLEIELGEIKLPYFAVPDGKNSEEYLKELCELGFQKRFSGGKTKEMEERLAYEMSVIEKTGFAPFFLIVHDFVNWAKKQGIVVGPGRGSCAASLVSYLLNITNIDPLRHGLFFERFLNPERVTMPDFDIDFADTRRDEVIRYVEEKYGKDHVAQIITFGTMAARAAIRDVGRVLNLPYSYCDRVAKMIPMFSSLNKALFTVPELKDIYDHDPDGKKLIDTAKKLEGVARHSSTHACGVVITKEPTDAYFPIQFASSGDETIVSQYSLHPIEDLGLLKIDFLGLKNLTVLENTINIVRAIHKADIDIDNIPLDDKKTFKLLQKGETTGVFQLESSGMKRYLRELKPTEFEDIIAMVSLYRPGPMDWIPDYIAGKQGLKVTHYLHPKLKPILEKTYGVAVYQEQILQVARDLAGFTLGEADVLRRAVAKKIPKLLLEQKRKFIDGCVQNEISKETADKIFDFIEPFAGYGFNRAHAASYALIAYQTAYLKAHYPVEFMASLLTSDEGDVDRVAILVEECNRMSLEVLPPEINESFKNFSVVPGAQPLIRFGLLAIKNVGENVVEIIIAERKKNGPYKNLEDFLSRAQTKDLNKKSLESLIKSGSLDAFGERNQLLVNIEQLLNFIKESQKAKTNGQVSLFDSPVLAAGARLRLQEAIEAAMREKLSWEKELLGLYISEHPFKQYEKSFSEIITPINTLNEFYGSAQVLAGGVITAVKKVITRTNEPMLFVKIEDTSASVEVLVFPSLLKANPLIWQEEKMVLVRGKLSDKDGDMKILVNEAEEIKEENAEMMIKKYSQANGFPGQASSAQAYGSLRKNIFIELRNVDDTEMMQKIKRVINNCPGNHRVYLKILDPGAPKKVETPFFMEYSDRVKSEIEGLTGGRVYVA